MGPRPCSADACRAFSALSPPRSLARRQRIINILCASVRRVEKPAAAAQSSGLPLSEQTRHDEYWP